MEGCSLGHRPPQLGTSVRHNEGSSLQSRSSQRCRPTRYLVRPITATSNGRATGSVRDSSPALGNPTNDRMKAWTTTRVASTSALCSSDDAEFRARALWWCMNEWEILPDDALIPQSTRIRTASAISMPDCPTSRRAEMIPTTSIFATWSCSRVLTTCVA